MAATAMVLTPAVRTAAASRSQPTPPAVRSLVHSAWMVVTSGVPPPQHNQSQGQGDGGPGAQDGEAGPGGQREEAVGDVVGVVYLGIGRDGLLDGERGRGGQPHQPGAGGGHGVGQDVGQHEQDDAAGDGPGAAAQDGAEGQHGDGGHGEQGGGSEHDAQVGDRADGQQVVAVVDQDVLRDRDGDRGGDQPGDEGDYADHDGLGGQDLAASGTGGQGDADEAAAVLDGDEQGGHDDQHDQADQPADQAVVESVAAEHAPAEVGGDITGPADGEGAAGLVVAARGQDRVHAAGPDAVPMPGRTAAADVVEDGLGHGGGAVAGLEGHGRGHEQPGLNGGVQSGQPDGADPGPAGAVDGVIAGEHVAGAGKPQPARRGGGDGAGQAGGVVEVVGLQADAVGAGGHDGGVGRALTQALLDDDPGLGPRGQGRRGVSERAAGLRDVSGGGGDPSQRGHPRGDAAVAGQGLADEVEAVGDGLAAGPDRDVGVAGGADEMGRVRADAGTAVLGEGGQDRDQRGHQGGDDEAGDPAAHSPELGPLGPKLLAEAVAAGGQGGVVGGGGHRAGSSASAARYS